jgi:Flp pilus assembly protein TadD
MNRRTNGRRSALARRRVALCRAGEVSARLGARVLGPVVLAWAALGCGAGGGAPLPAQTAQKTEPKERPTTPPSASVVPGPLAEPRERPGSLLDRPVCETAHPGCAELRAAADALETPGGAGRAEAEAHLARARELGAEGAALYVALGRFEARGESLAYGEGGVGTQRALGQFEIALTRDPECLVAELERARMLLALGRGQEAEPPLRKLLGLAPEDAEVRGALGVALLSQGQIGPARTELEKAAKLDPGSAERQVALGAVQMLLGDTTSAEASFRAAIHIEPAHARAHADLGALCLLQGKTREGRAHLERALGLGPENPAVLTNLAYADYIEGDLESAQKRAEQALTLDPRFASAWLNLALALSAQGKLERARQAILEAKKLNPEDPRVKTALEDLAGLERAP